jgi:hypothetical protein
MSSSEFDAVPFHLSDQRSFAMFHLSRVLPFPFLFNFLL